MGSPPPGAMANLRRQKEEEQRRALALASAVAESVEDGGVDIEFYRNTLGSGLTISVTNRVILANNPASGEITQIPVRQITNN